MLHGVTSRPTHSQVREAHPSGERAKFSIESILKSEDDDVTRAKGEKTRDDVTNAEMAEGKKRERTEAAGKRYLITGHPCNPLSFNCVCFH